MKSISWDLETYSSVDLTKCGVYRYCESEDFEILLAAYSIDGGAVQVTDLACGEKLPQEILDGWHFFFSICQTPGQVVLACLMDGPSFALFTIGTVSYTHLDVYKRQTSWLALQSVP